MVALGAIANVRLSAMLFDGPPLGMTDDRFVMAWVAFVTSLIDRGMGGQVAGTTTAGPLSA